MEVEVLVTNLPRQDYKHSKLDKPFSRCNIRPEFATATFSNAPSILEDTLFKVFVRHHLGGFPPQITSLNVELLIDACCHGSQIVCVGPSPHHPLQYL